MRYSTIQLYTISQVTSVSECFDVERLLNTGNGRSNESNTSQLSAMSGHSNFQKPYVYLRLLKSKVRLDEFRPLENTGSAESDGAG